MNLTAWINLLIGIILGAIGGIFATVNNFKRAAAWSKEIAAAAAGEADRMKADLRAEFSALVAKAVQAAVPAAVPLPAAVSAPIPAPVPLPPAPVAAAIVPAALVNDLPPAGTQPALAAQ